MPKSPNLLEDESVEEFDSLSTSLHAEFQPVTETERLLIEMMIHHEWLMRRAVRMQQQLGASGTTQADVDQKRLKLIVRYYRTHERAYSQAKRQLESMRTAQRKAEGGAARRNALASHNQRQWEQVLKKMPTLSNWVN